ncbi:MAG TPA: MarR family transcriptional regulator [Longimicrobiales bacterium]
MSDDANETRRDDAEARALKLWTVLARAYNAVAAHSRADIARHELTMAEFAVLEALFHKGPLLLGELQRKILVSSGGITYLVDRLVNRGLVERRPCATDRRAVYAALTAEGEALIRRIFPEHARAMMRAVSGLDDGEQQEAIRLLRHLGLAAAELEPGEAAAD